MAANQSVSHPWLAKINAPIWSPVVVCHTLDSTISSSESRVWPAISCDLTGASISANLRWSAVWLYVLLYVWTGHFVIYWLIHGENVRKDPLWWDYNGIQYREGESNLRRSMRSCYLEMSSGSSPCYSPLPLNLYRQGLYAHESHSGLNQEIGVWRFIELIC